ncbi:unnamed protein product, partial [Candidula unifasciata]
MARRLTQYLMTNKYIDTSVQKGDIPGVPGCLEHATMIWEAIQRAKHERTDLQVICEESARTILKRLDAVVQWS